MKVENRNLIYIMNHYSKNSEQHFYHLINLLDEITKHNVNVCLIIEKADDECILNNKNIQVIIQTKKNKTLRALELFIILSNLMKNGYKKVFTRISINAAVISILTAKINKAESYYWLSGTTIEIDKKNSIYKRLKWYLLTYPKLWFVKTFVNYFVTGPETMIKYYIEALNVKKEKMLLLYNDINLERFSKPNEKEKLTMRSELGFEENQKIILMVHRLSPVRKTDKYIPIIFEDSCLSECKFIIIGDGPEKELLEEKKLKSVMKNNIIFLGSKPNNEIEKFYKCSDIFINPSYTEGFPRVVIEAMACGLPVVATDAGGTKDIFGDIQKKYVVDKENVVLFREKLCELIEDNESLQKCSYENLNRVKKFSTEEVAEMYVKEIFR